MEPHSCDQPLENPPQIIVGLVSIEWLFPSESKK
jgi:hypothetical protein